MVFVSLKFWMDVPCFLKWFCSLFMFFGFCMVLFLIQWLLMFFWYVCLMFLCLVFEGLFLRFWWVSHLWVFWDFLSSMGFGGFVYGFVGVSMGFLRPCRFAFCSSLLFGVWLISGSFWMVFFLEWLLVSSGLFYASWMISHWDRPSRDYIWFSLIRVLEGKSMWWVERLFAFTLGGVWWLLLWCNIFVLWTFLYSLALRVTKVFKQFSFCDLLSLVLRFLSHSY